MTHATHPSTDPSLAQLLRDGSRAARANFGTAIVLWAVAMAVVGAYYFWPATRAGFQEVAAVKERYGVAFAAISTVIFGGILPWVVMWARPATRERATLGTLVFFALFWAEKGVEVDLLYRLQTFVFGEAVGPGGELNVWVVVLKTLADQGIFVPIWAVPSTVLAYRWKDSGFSLRRTWASLGPRWYRRRVVPVMVPNWGVWVPAVCIIYLLPVVLQLPLQNLVLCLWGLMLIFLTRDTDADSAL